MAEALKNKAIKGVGWSFADSILGQGMIFLVGLVLARLLTPEDYGLLAYLTILISVSNSLVDSGFSNALIRKKNAEDIDYNTTFITNLCVSIVVVVLLYFTAPGISLFFERMELISLIRVMSTILIINSFSLIQKTRLTKNVDFKTQTKASLISSMVSGLIGIGMALYGFGVWCLVGQQLSRQFLDTLFLWIFTKWYPKIQFSMKSFKELFGFGWKLLVSGLINTIWNETYQLVIGKCYTPATLGQYTRAHQFSSISSSNLTSIVQRVSYPILSELQDDRERLKAGYKRVIKVTMLVAFVLMLGLAAIAEPMIVSLIGEQWLPAVPMLQIVCFSMMLYPLHAINLNMLQVQGRSDLFLKLEIIKKIVAVGPLLLGIFVGIYWMLIGSVMTGFFAYYLNARYSGPFLKYSITEQIKDILPSFGVALTMALVVYVISYINISAMWLLLIQITVGALITFVLCELFKLEEYVEIKSIALSMLSKLRK
ncbi:lipopolysaccharide biosynthesis protein [Butyricimonas faecihominis]|uniref:lipopolysaccharide biosynthesis protein n=1 Tax=Butyricimonas faecihominis TaxID=1472416 RepID=UPI00266F624E|nr:lipopolysaccharide biosynthesis protein [Butyricimonas faecihominis]